MGEQPSSLRATSPSIAFLWGESMMKPGRAQPPCQAWWNTRMEQAGLGSHSAPSHPSGNLLITELQHPLWNHCTNHTRDNHGKPHRKIFQQPRRTWPG